MDGHGSGQGTTDTSESIVIIIILLHIVFPSIAHSNSLMFESGRATLYYPTLSIPNVIYWITSRIMHVFLFASENCTYFVGGFLPQGCCVVPRTFAQGDLLPLLTCVEFDSCANS